MPGREASGRYVLATRRSKRVRRLVGHEALAPGATVSDGSTVERVGAAEMIERARTLRALLDAGEPALGALRDEATALAARQPDAIAAQRLAADALAGAMDFDGAAACLQRVAELDPAHRGAALAARVALAERLGRVHEALRDLGQLRDAAAAAGDTARLGRLHAHTASLLAANDNPEAALPHLRAALARDPDAFALRMTLADTLLEARCFDEVAPALEHAAVLARPDDARFAGVASRIALAAGALDAARAFAERALQTDPGCASAHDTLGHLALFAGEIAGAARHAEALQAAGDTVTAHTLRGGAHALAGRVAEARAELDRAIALEPDACEALTLRGELRRAAGDFDGARKDLDRAMVHARGQLVVADMLRLLTTIRAQEMAPRVTYPAYAEFETVLATLCPDVASHLATLDRDGLADVVARALAALRGNRTAAGTFVREDTAGVPRLEPLRAGPGPRFASRRILNRVATDPPEALLTAFDALVEAYPRSSMPRCHRGELLGWLGRYDEAHEDLARTVADHPRTRWAYIGLAGLQNVAGRSADALETLALGIARMRDTTGPAVYVHRGEALWRLGRASDALPDLRIACELNPTRVSAWVNLGIALGRAGERAEPLRVFARLCERALPLLCDAASTLGMSLPAMRAAPTPDAVQAVLERALALMLANRSSTVVTYRVGKGALRRASDAPERCAEVNAAAARDRAAARALAERLARAR